LPRTPPWKCAWCLGRHRRGPLGWGGGVAPGTAAWAASRPGTCLRERRPRPPSIPAGWGSRPPRAGCQGPLAPRIPPRASTVPRHRAGRMDDGPPSWPPELLSGCSGSQRLAGHAKLMRPWGLKQLLRPQPSARGPSSTATLASAAGPEESSTGTAKRRARGVRTAPGAGAARAQHPSSGVRPGGGGASPTRKWSQLQAARWGQFFRPREGLSRETTRLGVLEDSPSRCLPFLPGLF